jgi:Protein of unknown function (DUF4089)
MSGMENLAFPELTARELEAYAHQTSSDLGLSIPDAYLSSVLDNLAALQSHAAILATALAAAETLRSPVP